MLLDTGTTLFVLVGLKAIDSLCFVVLVLNDLAPDRVDSRTGKWGQTRKLRDRTKVAVR